MRHYFRLNKNKASRSNYNSTPFIDHKSRIRPISVKRNMIEQFPFKPKLNKISRSLSSNRKSKTYVFQKLYEEDK